MEKSKKPWKFFSWNTLCIIMVSCLLNAVIWDRGKKNYRRTGYRIISKRCKSFELPALGQSRGKPYNWDYLSSRKWK